MWAVEQQIIQPGNELLGSVRQDSRVLSYSEVLDLWMSNAGFCEFFSQHLADCPYQAFRWETPPITSETMHRPFEFVLVNSPYLCIRPDAGTFAQHFAGTFPGGVVNFRNLGGDATLVAPCPDTGNEDYAHLAAFLRNAPVAQKVALWSMLGRTVKNTLSDEPLWVSTAGDGIAWLHVRVDRSPKYYQYRPFRALM